MDPVFDIVKFKKLRAKRDSITAEIANMAAVCPHKHLYGKYGANTGNWCPADDHYWVDFWCTDCDSRWSEDQNEQRYEQQHDVSKRGYVWIRVDSWHDVPNNKGGS